LWYSLGFVRGKKDSETILIEDLRIFMMAILRLNDGKHFLIQPAESKVEKVYGAIN
jgi:hypothetical protein